MLNPQIYSMLNFFLKLLICEICLYTYGYNFKKLKSMKNKSVAKHGKIKKFITNCLVQILVGTIASIVADIIVNIVILIIQHFCNNPK